MKRGSFTGTRKPLNRVSAKVRAERLEFSRVYAQVDGRSQGRCEVELTREVLFGPSLDGHPVLLRCPYRATEHHHVRKPRRVFHQPQWIIAICRHHHDMTTSAYATGRLLIEPRGEGVFTCAVVTKASKFA